MPTFLQVLAGLVPSVGVGLLFWFAMRAIVQADRRERLALARLDARAAEGTGAHDDAPAVPGAPAQAQVPERS